MWGGGELRGVVGLPGGRYVLCEPLMSTYKANQGSGWRSVLASVTNAARKMLGMQIPSKEGNYRKGREGGGEGGGGQEGANQKKSDRSPRAATNRYSEWSRSSRSITVVSEEVVLSPEPFGLYTFKELNRNSVKTTTGNGEEESAPTHIGEGATWPAVKAIFPDIPRMTFDKMMQNARARLKRARLPMKVKISGTSIDQPPRIIDSPDILSEPEFQHPKHPLLQWILLFRGGYFEDTRSDCSW